MITVVCRSAGSRYFFHPKQAMLDYSLWVGIGASLGLWRMARSAEAANANRWVNAGWLVLLLALVGARTSYVLQNQAYFALHLLEMPMFWLGGLTWPGAVLGGLMAAGILVVEYRSPRTGKLSPGWLGDSLYPLLPPLAVSAWLGCWQAGIGYGPLAPQGAWWALRVMDQDGLFQPRWPLQPLAAISLLVLFALLERWHEQTRGVWAAGRLAVLGLNLLLLHLLVFSLLAADPWPAWNGLRLDTWLALGLMVGFTFTVFVYRLLARSRRRTGLRRGRSMVRRPGGRQAD